MLITGGDLSFYFHSFEDIDRQHVMGFIIYIVLQGHTHCIFVNIIYFVA